MECRSSDVRSSLCRLDDEAMRLLNFTNNMEEGDSKGHQRSKTPRDPLSHRIIEKRRRDRMNNCLADLSRLIPPSYMKQGQGRIEKTEIIEMAISLIKTLSDKVSDLENNQNCTNTPSGPNGCCKNQLTLGFHECKDETIRFLVENEGMCASDGFVKRIMAHLQTSATKLMVSVSEQHKEKKPDTKVVDLASSGDGGFGSDMSPKQQSLSDQNLQECKDLLDNKNLSQSSESGLSHLTHASLALPYSRADFSYSNSSDGTFTDFIRPGCEMGGQGNGQGTIYKFKHNITKRFSQEKNGSNPSDTSSSSSSSREDAGKLQRRKLTRLKGRGQGFRLSPYPSSSDMSSGSGNISNSNSSYQGDVSGLRSDSSNSPPDTSSNNMNMQSTNIPLPGFVLHPAGTHYLPISIHPNVIPECFRQNTNLSPGMGLFHPISIPVQFCGPYISMGDREVASVKSASSGELGFHLPLTYQKQPGTKETDLVL